MSSTGRRTKAGDREDRKAEAAELLGEARRAAGMSATALAEAAGVSRTLVRAWEDEEDFDHPAPLDALLVPALQREAAKLLGQRAGLAVFELPETEGLNDDLRLATDVQREASEAVQAFLAAIADGIVTRAENAHVREEAHQAIEALARLVRTLERTADEPCVGIRRVS